MVAKAVAGLISVALLVMAVLSLASSGGYATQGLAVGLVFTGLGITMSRTLTGSFNPLSIYSVFAYCHVALFLARPWYMVTFKDGINVFTGAPYGLDFVQAELVAGLGFLSISVAYGVAAGKISGYRLRPPLQPMPQEQWRRISPILIAVVAVGFSLYLAYIFQTGWTSYWSGTLSGRSDEQRSALSSASGYLYSGLQFATGASLLLFLEAIVSRKKRLAVGWLLFVAITVFPQIASGSRATFIPVVVTVLAILARTNPKILQFRRVLVWLPVGFVLGFIAPRLWRDQLAQGTSLIDSLAQALTPEALFDGFLGGLDLAMVDALAVQTSAHFSGNLDYLYGASYIAALAAPIPRSFWSGKPESIDEWLNQALFPVTDSRGIGFAFSTYSEPLANFGIGGVIVMMCVFGLLMGWLARRTENSPRLMNTYFYAIFAGYMFPLVRGSFTFNIQRVLIPILPVVASIFLSRRRQPPTKRREPQTRAVHAPSTQKVR